VSDGAPEERHGDFKKEVGRIQAKQHLAESSCPWQNRAEAEIGEVKKGIKCLTSKKNWPKWLWDWCGTLVAAIRRLTAHDFPALNGLSPQENIHARTPDISPYTQFGWYKPVWYIDTSDGIKPRCKLGMWIGIAEDVGKPLTWWILPESFIAKP